MEAKRAYGLNPKTMQELNCTILPSAEYPLPKLRKMKVVQEVHKTFASMEKSMRISFRALTEGGVELTVNVIQPGSTQNVSAVKSLVVSEEKLAEMRKAEKNERVPLANPGDTEPFLVVLSSNFCTLVTDLSRTQP